jgi:predicted nuclease of predicted toxin-antitoxin system
MAKPKIYIDEDVHDGLAAALRREGFDAISAREAGRKQASDLEQLEFATSEGRAILSFNIADYEALAEQYFLEGKEHCGIIVSPRRYFRELLHRLLKLLHQVEDTDLKNQLWYL